MTHFSQTILKTRNHAFQFSFCLGIFGQFIRPFLVFVIKIDVIGIQFSLKPVFLSQIEKLPDQSQRPFPIVRRPKGCELNQNFLETSFCNSTFDTLPDSKRVFPFFTLGLNDPIGIVDFKHQVEKLSLPTSLNEGIQFVDLVFLNFDAELSEMAPRRPMIRICFQDHLENFEGLVLVPATSGSPVFPEQGAVLGNFLIVKTIEQVNVFLRPIRPDVQVLLLAQSAPLRIVTKGKLLHQGKDVGRLFGKFTRREILSGSNQGDAVFKTFVNLGSILSVFLGKRVIDRIGGGILTQGFFYSVNESIDIHSL